MNIKDLFNAFCKLFEAKHDEIDDFLEPYQKLSKVQIDYMLRVINDEIAKSRKFGLEILPEHQHIEKHAIISIFNEWGQTLNAEGEKYSTAEYGGMMHDLIKMVSEMLQEQITYYFEHTPKGETSNRYNCHIVSLVTRLAKDFMDQKCAPWMAKNTPIKQ